MKNYSSLFFLLLCFIGSILVFSCNPPANIHMDEEPLISYVNPINGTDGKGAITPVAVMPFGMVQLGPDTRKSGSGYHYEDSSIIGFSHIHKSGGGCSDFLDILLQPFTGTDKFESGSPEDSDTGYRSVFTHEQEQPSVGLYQVKLLDYNIDVQLTATQRCGMHRYYYPNGSVPKLILDLQHGSEHNCTIVQEDQYDTVKVASLKIINSNKLEGSRISVGWAEEMHVYFAMEFSRPFKSKRVWDNGTTDDLKSDYISTDIRTIFEFEPSEQPLMVRVGISNVSTEGAWRNLQSEITDWDFDRVVAENWAAWEKQLSKFKIQGGTNDQRVIFYTGLYHTFTYPMLFSDIDGKFRGPDHQVHQADGYDNYSGVIGIWDTYRSALPLLYVANPKVSSDFINTLLDHHDIYGMLPVWTLWGNETFCMLGYHSLPVIADAYSKGVRGFDTERALKAMITTAEKDTFGYWMRRWIGLKNYKEYGYVPADLEFTSVSKTLEYAYDDWCLAQMGQMLGNNKVFQKYMDRSKAYQNLYDPTTGFMRGKSSSGAWSSPFHPRSSNHWLDDYAEGTAWQWTFFVPHDVDGLAALMGGREKFIQKLDSLFLVSSELLGESPAGDIDGLIGQYAHGNEPGHHTLFMYNLIEQPWKSQEKARQIMETFYLNSPLAYSGNEDTGQMASWYVWNAIGLYPYTHGNGIYAISSPLFDQLELTMGNTPESPRLRIKVENNSAENIYVRELYLNGKPYKKATIEHHDLLNTELRYVMGNKPGDWFKQ